MSSYGTPTCKRCAIHATLELAGGHRKAITAVGAGPRCLPWLADPGIGGAQPGRSKRCPCGEFEWCSRILGGMRPGQATGACPYRIDLVTKPFLVIGRHLPPCLPESSPN